MDLKVAHDFIRNLLQKERGGFVSPEECDDYLDRAQWWHYNTEFNNYAKTQELKDSLAPFSTKFQFTSSSIGLVTLPINQSANPCYEHLLSMYVQYFDNTTQKIRRKSIKFMSEDEMAERLDSQILEPLFTEPAGEQLTTGIFQLYPQVTLTGYGYYLRRPLKPVFNYTLGVDGRTITYNQSASVQLEWNESSINKILIKAVQLAGVAIGDDGIVQFAEVKNQQDI